ncbi:MAG: metallophosphoesterase family protein [Pelovirga sp.]
MIPTRLIAIGDIHGQLDQLNRLLDQVSPSGDDRLVFLGDYVDRGKDSKGVVDRLNSLRREFPQTVFIRGNHDQLLLDALVELGIRQAPTLRDRSALYGGYAPLSDLDVFLDNGGKATLSSYNFNQNKTFPDEHLSFLESTRLWWRFEHFVFVHAGVAPDIPMDEQDPFTLMWERSSPPGRGGEIHVIGHNPTMGFPRFEAGRYCLDTGAVYGQRLTACDVLTRKSWQA